MQSRQRKYEQRRAEVSVAFERELWDEKVGLYRDGKPNQNHREIGRWLPEDKPIETHSPHVNALAVLYDLAPASRQRDIMNRLSAQPKLNVQPYFMHFVFAAEAHAGTFNSVALGQLHLWQLNPETQTFTENFGGGDYSHAWGGTPLIQMSSRILGVTASHAGAPRLRIEPLTAGLPFARGVVPTAAGDVVVNWTASQDTFVLDLTLPGTVPADIILPGSRNSDTEIWLDGKQQKRGTVTVRGGSHHLVAKPATRGKGDQP